MAIAEARRIKHRSWNQCANPFVVCGPRTDASLVETSDAVSDMQTYDRWTHNKHIRYYDLPTDSRRRHAAAPACCFINALLIARSTRSTANWESIAVGVSLQWEAGRAKRGGKERLARCGTRVKTREAANFEGTEGTMERDAARRRAENFSRVDDRSDIDLKEGFKRRSVYLGFVREDWHGGSIVYGVKWWNRRKGGQGWGVREARRKKCQRQWRKHWCRSHVLPLRKISEDTRLFVTIFMDTLNTRTIVRTGHSSSTLFWR